MAFALVLIAAPRAGAAGWEDNWQGDIFTWCRNTPANAMSAQAASACAAFEDLKDRLARARSESSETPAPSITVLRGGTREEIK